MIKSILISYRNQTFFASCQVSLICLILFSFTANAYADSIILNTEPKVVYGNDIKIAGTIFFDEINFHAGIPVSMEIRDDTGNVIDAQSTTPNRDGTFYFAVSGDKTKVFDGTKSFTVTVYYGSPNPSLLNTKYSTTDSFKVVKPADKNNPVQNNLQEINDDKPDLQQNTITQTADKVSEYSPNLLIVIAVVVLVPAFVILLKIIKSRRMWKRAELLASKANEKVTKTTIHESYIR